MAEWSKAPDSSSGLRKGAWVRTPLLTEVNMLILHASTPFWQQPPLAAAAYSGGYPPNSSFASAFNAPGKKN
ncbi:unnamed protein product [Sphagnum jensenii]